MAIVNVFMQGLAMFSDVGIGPASFRMSAETIPITSTRPGPSKRYAEERSS